VKAASQKLITLVTNYKKDPRLLDEKEEDDDDEDDRKTRKKKP
jgi:biopolymer transport protein ExbB